MRLYMENDFVFSQVFFLFRCRCGDESEIYRIKQNHGDHGTGKRWLNVVVVSACPYREDDYGVSSQDGRVHQEEEHEQSRPLVAEAGQALDDEEGDAVGLLAAVSRAASGQVGP